MNIILLLIFLLCIGIFAGFEVGFYVINPVRLDILTEKKDRRALLLKYFKKNKEHLIISILIATNLFNYMFSGLLVLTLNPIDPKYRIFLSTLIGTGFVFLFAETYPKFLFQSYPNKLPYYFVRFIYYFHLILSPISYILKIIAGIFSMIFRIKKRSMSFVYGRKSIVGFIDQAHSLRLIDKSKKEMLYSILNLKDLKVIDIIIQKDSVISFYMDDEIEYIIDTIKTENYKRYPVMDRKTNEIIKILNSMSLYWNEDKYRYIKDLGNELIDPIFIQGESSQLSAMHLMQAKKSIMAIVKNNNEYAGIITLRDIIDNSITKIKDL